MSVPSGITPEQVKAAARECGFELAGITSALSHADFERFESWREAGYAGEMGYLTDRRGDLRADPRELLPEARTMICVAKLYNTPHPQTDRDPKKGWISRYAWGQDYHEILRESLGRLALRLEQMNGGTFAYRVCVDTAPLLERSYARSAGLGWIGRNTCLINQQQGSWFFLGELLTSLELQPDAPPPDRCGSCTRCIDACPTAALVPGPGETWTLDARRCISYLTIEKRGPFDPEHARQIGNHVFGCDICQDVCPWNRRAPVTADERFLPAVPNRDLAWFSEMTQEQFRDQFRFSAVKRAKYQGFLRNVAAATAAAVSLAATASAKVEDPLQNPGFVHFYNLEYEAALSYFRQQAQLHPDDINQYNHIAQTILYRQMYHEGELTTALVGASNSFLFRPKLHLSDEAKSEFNHAIDHVLNCSGSENDVRIVYAKGAAHGLRANYMFLAEKDYIGALREATAARKANEQVLALDPQFVDARMILGLYKYVVGSLPFYMRMFSFVGGFQGDVQGGIGDLEVVRTRGVLNRYDAEVLLAAMYRREREYDKAAALLKAATARFPKNPVLRSELQSLNEERSRHQNRH